MRKRNSSWCGSGIIERIFGSKGEAVVEMNHRAFNIGYEYSLKKTSSK